MKILTRISLIFIVLFTGTTLFAVDANNGDSIVKENLTDTNGHRQGYWHITGAISIEEGYRNGQLIEEGTYLNNKREGIWKKYFPTGKIQSEITYADNHPFGSYKIFFPNGEVEEEGIWLINKNTGDFIRYYDSGQIAQIFKFNRYGKRQGIQEYYFENGKIQMQVEIENGIAHGIYKTYHPDGSPHTEKRMTNGKIEEGSFVIIEARTKTKYNNELPSLPRSETKPRTTDKPNLAEFKATGFNTLYNINKQVTQVGDFINGRLNDGKWYRYDDNGLLHRVEVYKNGRFIGYGIIDDSNN